MNPTAEQLYDLLPAVYRLRDTALASAAGDDEGTTTPAGPLRALLAILAEQLDALRDDMDQLYDDQFIETCAEWVVPYIGDLIGAQPVHGVTTQTVSQRAQVANMIRYRRRKGTADVLEELARDVTGWPARAVEYFLLLATTQYLNGQRPDNLAFTGLRDTAALELIGTPFATTAHTADVRRIGSRRGKYNLPDIGLFLWRLQPFLVSGAEPHAVTGAAPGLYTFNPLGLDGPLYNPLRAKQEQSRIVAEYDVPGQLRRRPLWQELNDRRATTAAGKSPEGCYFGSEPVLQIFTERPDGAYDPIDPADLFVCSLANWPRPSVAGQAWIDPVLGRLSFMDPPPPGVRVSYSYAFGAEMGGGPYDRTGNVGEWLPVTQPAVTFQRGVTRNRAERDAALADPLVATLGEAVAAWQVYLTSTTDEAPFGIIVIMDSATYTENLSIEVPRGARLAIIAGQWPRREVEVAGLPVMRRVPGDLTPAGDRPVLAGSITIVGTSGVTQITGDPPHQFILDGLLVTGPVTVQAGDLRHLRIANCTLVPSGGGLTVVSGPGAGADNRFLTVQVVRSIIGPVHLGGTVPELAISGSIVAGDDGGDPAQGAIVAADTDARIDTTTIFGTSGVRSLSAQHSLFTGVVAARRGQVGCVRYCYLPPGSRTPRPYRCQPDRAVSAALAEAKERQSELPAALVAAITAEVRARVVPQFTSARYGDAAYAQLSSLCAAEIRTSAEDESELGAFHDLFQPQREINLRIRLDEFLRFGMEAGIFYVT